MSDNLKPLPDVFRATTLARIAEALGLPPSSFYKDGDGQQSEQHAELADAAVLALVRGYLQVIEPAARHRFADQVKALVEELSP